MYITKVCTGGVTSSPYTVSLIPLLLLYFCSSIEKLYCIMCICCVDVCVVPPNELTSVEVIRDVCVCVHGMDVIIYYSNTT